MNGIVSRPVTPEPVKAKRTYLDLPNTMAEAYMDAVFQHGPASKEALYVYQKYRDDQEWGQLFCEFAQAIDELKMAVGAGAAEGRAVSGSADRPTVHKDAAASL